MLYKVNQYILSTHKTVIFNFRRDKESCHECRFCCTLSVCTTKKGSTFRFSNKSINLAQETGSDSEKTPAFGFLTDQRMYKNHVDHRCLKPNPKIPSSKWGHFEMHGYRAAKTKAELGVNK